MSGVEGGRATRGGPVTEWVVAEVCVLEWKEVSSRRTWVRVKIESWCLYRYIYRVVRGVRRR